MTATTLLLGATGDQGLPLMRRLLARGHSVRAATRRPNAFPSTEYPDVEPVAVDLADESSLAAAAEGMDAILMHLPFTYDRAYARIIGAAIAGAAAIAGVDRIIFHTSCVVMDADIGVAAHDARRDIEAALGAAGVRTVFLRSTVFMDNLLRRWAKPSIVQHDVFAYPASPELRISWIAQDDVASYMVAALESSDPPGRITVGGPEALTGGEVAARLSLAAGRPIAFRNLSPDEFASAMSKLVTGSTRIAPGSIYDGMAAFYRWYNAQPHSPLVTDPKTSLGVLPVRPTPFLVWANGQNWTEA